MKSIQEKDSVRIKDGICHPDEEGLLIEGWKGWVRRLESTDQGNNTVLVLFDSETLDKLPEQYIIDSEKQGLAWSELWLFVDQVERIELRDTYERAMTKRNELLDRYSEYHWFGLGEQGERIFEILKDIGGTDESVGLEGWKQYLEERFDYPVKAKIQGSLNVQDFVHDSFDRGESVQIREIFLRGPSMGLIAEINSTNESIQLPLTNLEITNKDTDANKALEDYKTWDANR